MYSLTVNPGAGSGKGLGTWKTIVRYTDSHNIEYETSLTEGIGDARTVARRLTDSHDEPRYIIVVGGEGIMDEVLDGMSFHGLLNLGYIPAGSGSDLARGLRTPGRTIKCLKKQPAPRHSIMIGHEVLAYGNQEIPHRWFLANAGIGPGAAICQGTLSSKCRQRLNHSGMGKLSYILMGIYQFFKCKSGRGHILLGRVKEIESNNTLFIPCHIQPSGGGGFLFAPRAGGSDGELSIYVMSHSTRIKLIPALLSVLIGRRQPRGVRTYEYGEVFIYTEAALPVYTDGESCGFQTDTQASCIVKKVRVMI